MATGIFIETTFENLEGISSTIVKSVCVVFKKNNVINPWLLKTNSFCSTSQ